MIHINLNTVSCTPALPSPFYSHLKEERERVREREGERERGGSQLNNGQHHAGKIIFTSIIKQNA